MERHNDCPFYGRCEGIFAGDFDYPACRAQCDSLDNHHKKPKVKPMDLKMQRRDVENLYARNWIRSKGVGIWPNTPYDPQDPEGQEKLAEWFLDEIQSYVDYKTSIMKSE